MAVDAAVMVVTVVRDYHQNWSLLHACGMFISPHEQVDRDQSEPSELVVKLEEVLGIDAYPMNWPMGIGKNLLALRPLQ